MTIEEYWAIVHKLHLTRTKVATIFLNENMETQYVREPSDLNHNEIRALAKRLIIACGRELDEFGLSDC